MTMIAGGDEKVRNAFRATLRDEPSRPNVAATEELSANDILEVHDLANAIARAEQIIRTPSSRPSDLDIFDALLRPSSRDGRDDRAPVSPHAILSPSAVPLAPGHVASKATLNPGPDPLLTATDDTSGPALPASDGRTVDSAPDSEPPRTKRSVREVMQARAARMEARGPYRALDLDAEIRADAAGEDYVLTSGNTSGASSPSSGASGASKVEANAVPVSDGADANAAPIATAAPAVPPPPPSSASTTAVFLSSLAPRPASSAPALPGGGFAVTATLQMPAAPAKPQIIYVNEDDAYYQPGGRMRAFADGTLETRAADATLLVRLQSRQKSLSLVVACVVGALALVALLGFALRHSPESEAPSTTTTTSSKTPEAKAEAPAPKAEAPKAEPALAPSLQAKPGQPAGAKGRVPVFDVNSLPSAPAR